ncbi:tRNA dihydrouridine synthase DusB [Pseudobacteriovorax antillogorgiicola]|uniref:tRNA-dihydrouridine synthase n=1 Tax=Pseudobacteriovorax antillogorgiicola TaxID=1513793 RepID=A0A1Y6CDS9_9BACT|nr:tRNA dihydrouridine synthase DusB [Pseudobacteriovorax antillogorgiicola]TCS51808.1 tRNA-U20-dihydrouridine synthase [Pseudobacteriovorax antillogorgiicola]SMF50171.1 tRNA-U20-dihydrouridine synthase [Pseudobacteriovorax antillogorgiicola]
MTKVSPFQRLGISENPVVLAPLAGVSDHPFRRICSRHGADLTYVEMISATAMIYESRRTYRMLKRHESESVLGVQITGRSAEDVGKAAEILHDMPFDTIDINMGCPVKKVVKTGCGSAILKEPDRVYDTVKALRNATDKVISAKIRIGWDHSSINGIEIARAIEEAGADFMTVHGRTRNDDYSKPVDLEYMAQLKTAVSIPLIGNGNLFSAFDGDYMTKATKVDGLMVSRGALGNPWIFNDIKKVQNTVSLEDWLDTVSDHLKWQQEEYGDVGAGAVCMRKHLLWYAKGWPGVKALREKMNVAESLQSALAMVQEFAEQLASQGITHRFDVTNSDAEGRFVWDPKYDMDRKLDRGVGDDGLSTPPQL